MERISIQTGLPLFSDNFNTELTFAENWIIGKHSVSKENHLELCDGSVSLRSELPEEFVVSFDVVLQANKSLTVILCGVKAEIIGNHLTVGTDHCSFGDGSLSSFPVRAARVCEEDHTVCAFGIGSEWLLSKETNEKQGGKCSIVSDGAEIRSFRLSTVKKSDNESPNLTINSSFEYLQDDFPLFITRSCTAKFELGYKLDYDQYLDTVSSDSTEHHSGRYSLRVTNNGFTNGQKISFHQTATLPGIAGVLSAWLKTDREGMKAVLIYGEARKTVTVSSEWERFEVVNPKLDKQGTYSPAWIIIPADEKGTVWIDDVQAEFLDLTPSEAELNAGKSLASPYRPSELDKDKFNTKCRKPTRAESVIIPLLPDGVRPSVILDHWKGYAVQRDDFYTQNKTPTNRTEVYLACDRDALYIGYRNFGEDFSFSKEQPHDSFAIFTHGIECHLSPDGSGKGALQFAANATGSRVDIGFNGNVAWDGEWSSEAVPNPEKNSVDYLMTLPMAVFAGSDITNSWLVNICRTDGQNREADAIARTPIASYKLSDYWPKAELPEEVIQHYKFGVNAAELMLNDAGATMLLEIQNESGKDRKISLTVTTTEGKHEQLFQGHLIAKSGVTKIEFPVSAQPKHVGIRIYENDRLIFDRHLGTSVHSMATMLGRLSYYMKEPEAEYQISLGLTEPEKYKAVLECEEIRTETVPSGKFRISFPITTLAPGTYDVRLKILEGDTIICTAHDTLMKREYRAGASQINHFTRSVLLNGKPVVPFAPFIDYHADFITGTEKEFISGQLDWLKSYHFKFLHHLAYNRTVAYSRDYLAEAEKRGIQVILWTDYRNVPSDRLPALMADFDFDNIIAHQYIDEPELFMKSDETLALLNRIRPHDPYHPVFMNNTVLGISNAYANLETDILMLDDYLTNSLNRSVESVVSQNDICCKVGETDGKPYYYFLVGSNFPLHYREPSYGEQIAQCYGSIAAGCTGISLFYGWPQTKGNWRAVVQLADEIEKLTDILTDEEECEDVLASADNKILRIRTKKHGNSVYVISCNIDKEPLKEVIFSLPEQYGKVNSASVLFENRTVPVENGIFTDRFEKWTRHIYKIDLSIPR